MPKIDPIPQNVSIAAIRPGRHRPLDPQAVQSLVASIKEVGILNAITVRRLDADPGEPTFVVVAGDHRLAAAAEVGLKFVPVHIVDLPDLQAQIASIDENLYRHDLSPAEETAAVARRRSLWEAIHADRQSGTATRVALPAAPSPQPASPSGENTPARAIGGRGHKGFTTEVAELTGMTPATARRVAKRAAALGADTASKLVGTALDRPGELDALAAADAETRADLIERAVAGEDVSARPHKPRKQPDAASPEPPTAPYRPRAPEDYVDDLMQALRACAAHLSIDAVAKYQITGRLTRAERELIHSLASEPAMADVQDGLFDPRSAGTAPATANATADDPDAPSTPASAPATTPGAAETSTDGPVPAARFLQACGLDNASAHAEAAKAMASPAHVIDLPVGQNGVGRWHPAPDAVDLLDTP